MQTRQLGCSDMKITPLGIGTWAIGGPEGNYNWGPQDDKDSIGAIHKALDLGMNWIDTAPAYGKGRSEEVVGKAIKSLSTKPFVFTKNSLTWKEDRVIFNCLKADSIRKECEDSLRRLGVETLDLWQIHWPNPDADIEEGWTEMAKLQKAGKVRWIAVSNFSVSQMKRAQAIAPIASLQPPYSAIRRDIEAEILPFCARENIGVIAYSPMQAGLLSGKMSKERVENLAPNDWRRNNENFKEPKLSKNLALQEIFKKIAAHHGHPAGVAAIAWVLRRSEITGAIVGLRTAQQAEELAPALRFRLSLEELKEIENLFS
ncbi:MAG TPA: aldo/keto reductase [bacterium]|nr:aldo/keto reductase [bacterium]